MAILNFDGLAYSRQLQAAGISREHADAIAQAQAEALNTSITLHDLATKKDLQLGLSQQKNDLELKIEQTRNDLELKMEQTKNDLEAKIAQLRHDLELKIEQTRNDLELKIEQTKNDLEARIAQTKSDLELQLKQMEVQIATSKADIIKWMVSCLIAQSAVLAGIFAYFR